MTLLDDAKALYEQVRGLTRDARMAILKGLPEAVQEAYHAFHKDQMYAPENVKGSKEFLSPSGKYKLVVTSFETGKGTWNVTEGKVFRQDSDTPIGAIRRNYSSFPFLFVEDHTDGHDYLIGGEDYQGQTVLQLTTGQKRGLLPEEAKQGHGFCWADYTYDAKSQILVVDGCFWACPYETRLYDFSHPMQGWPQLEYEGLGEDPENWVEDDRKRPTFEADGTITTYQTKYGDPEDEDSDWEEDRDGKPKSQRIVSTRTWKREGLKLVEAASWVSDDEKTYRAEQEAAQKRYQDWLDNFRATDPLHLEAVKLKKEEPFKADAYMSIGGTYEKWCPDFKEDERRICYRIAQANPGYTIDLEWAHATGPIKLVIFKDGNMFESKFFMEHSVASMQAAFAYARALL